MGVDAMNGETTKKSNKMVLVIVAVVVVIALGVGAWWWLSKSPAERTIDESPEARAALSQCETALGDKDLCTFVTASAQGAGQKDYELRYTMQGMNVVMRVDAEGNSEMSSTGEGETTKMVHYQGATYTWDEDAAVWYKFETAEGSGSTESTEGSNELPLTKFDDDYAKHKDAFVRKDKQACGELTCFAYEFKDGESVTTILFDDKDYKAREYRYTAADGEAVTMHLSYGVEKVSEPTPSRSYQEMVNSVAG